MEELDYRELVKKIIYKYANKQPQEDLENTEIVFDTERDRYLLLYVNTVQLSNFFLLFLLSVSSASWRFVKKMTLTKSKPLTEPYCIICGME